MPDNSPHLQDLIIKVEDTWYCSLHWGQEVALAQAIYSALKEAPEGTTLLIQTQGRWSPAEARLIQLHIDPTTNEYRVHNVFTDRLIHKGQCDITDSQALINLLRKAFPTNSQEEQ